MTFLRTTLIGGALLLVPLVFVAIILQKAYALSLKVARPVGRLIEVDGVSGVLIADIIAVLLILAVCLVGGLIAHMPFVSRYIGRLDSILLQTIPGYGIAKGMLGGMTDTEAAMASLKPVLVRLDDSSQIAFEMDRSDDRVVLFLPGAPSPWSGSTLIVDADRVIPIDTPPNKIIGSLQVLGRGAADLLPDPPR